MKFATLMVAALCASGCVERAYAQSVSTDARAASTTDAAASVMGDQIGVIRGVGGLGPIPASRREVSVPSIGELGHGAGIGSSRGFSGGPMGVRRPSGRVLRARTQLVGGGLAPDLVRTLLRRVHSQFSYCFELARMPVTAPTIEVAVRFVVAASSGTTATPSAIDVQTTNVMLRGCLEGRVRAMVFPRPTAGQPARVAHTLIW